MLIFNAPWRSCYDGANVNSTVVNWMNMLLLIAKTCIPHYQTTIRPDDKLFMNSDIRKLMRKRDRLRRIYLRTNDENIRNEYKRQRNLVVHVCREAEIEKQSQIASTISNVKTSSRKWWKLLKSTISNVNFEGGEPLVLNGKLITDDRDKADIFNRFFALQSTLDDRQAHIPNNTPVRCDRFDQLVVQPEIVYDILSKLDPAKATGPDGIGNRILKEAALPLAEPLSHIFNYCLSLGMFPDVWKIACVTPLFKKGEPSDCNNYRPISLLPCISKVFERVLFNHVHGYLRVNGLISQNQSGFTPGDGTINQLIAICNTLYKCIDDGDEMIAVFLDLSKAFDKVWHAGLLYKLQVMGINGKLFDVITSYLNNYRQQYVSLSGASSSLISIKAGVPQGSVMGPLLFLVYINDISDVIQSDHFLFADDTSVFQRVHNGDIRTSTRYINDDMYRIQLWTKRWLVTINSKKSEVMLFSKKRSPSVLLPVIIDGNTLPVVESHKHLGMTLSSRLSWSLHINYITLKCKRILGMLSRYKHLWSRSALEVCYISFIRPILEYGNILYDCCSIADSTVLEGVQLDAIRLVTGAKRCTSHAAMYRELGWINLKTRRKIHRLIKFYCIVNNLTPI